MLEMFCWRRLGGLCAGDLSQQQHAGSDRRTDDRRHQQLRACHGHCSPALSAAASAVGEYPGGSSCWRVPLRLRPRGSGLGASGTGLGFVEVRGSGQHSVAQHVLWNSQQHTRKSSVMQCHCAWTAQMGSARTMAAVRGLLQANYVLRENHLHAVCFASSGVVPCCGAVCCCCTHGALARGLKSDTGAALGLAGLGGTDCLLAGLGWGLGLFSGNTC